MKMVNHIHRKQFPAGLKREGGNNSIRANPAELRYHSGAQAPTPRRVLAKNKTLDGNGLRKGLMGSCAARAPDEAEPMTRAAAPGQALEQAAGPLAQGRETAFAKIRARVLGTALAAEALERTR